MAARAAAARAARRVPWAGGEWCDGEADGGQRGWRGNGMREAANNNVECSQAAVASAWAVAFWAVVAKSWWLIWRRRRWGVCGDERGAAAGAVVQAKARAGVSVAMARAALPTHTTKSNTHHLVIMGCIIDG